MFAIKEILLHSSRTLNILFFIKKSWLGTHWKGIPYPWSNIIYKGFCPCSPRARTYEGPIFASSMDYLQKEGKTYLSSQGRNCEESETSAERELCRNPLCRMRRGLYFLGNKKWWKSIACQDSPVYLSSYRIRYEWINATSKRNTKGISCCNKPPSRKWKLLCAYVIFPI